MYGHHGSKAAGNMVGHLLGYDLKERGVPIAMIHVSHLCPPNLSPMRLPLHTLSGLMSMSRLGQSPELTVQPGFLKTGQFYLHPRRVAHVLHGGHG